jgi:hypothetical protein
VADKSVLATIEGTMLAPGVSKNNRLYTQAAIGRAVSRMQERLRSPEGLPVVMRTHHNAGDDSSKIVGRITDVQQESNGAAKYKAVLFNNTAGQDLAPLLKPDPITNKPALGTTSIYGYWVGPVEHVQHNGSKAETGNDLEIDALDFTASPGVSQSRINSVTFESTSLSPRRQLLESVEATVTVEPIVEVVDESEKLEVWERKFTAKQRKSMSAAGQAMPGGRYPIANKSDLRNAIRAVGRGSGSHDAIRAHIIRRARALGLADMIPDNWSSSGSRKENKSMPKAAAIAEHSIKVCVCDMDGNEVKICADNLHPDLVKKAIKRAGQLIDQIIDTTDLGDMDEDDMLDDLDSVDFKVITCSPDGDYDDDDVPDMDANMNGGDSDYKETVTVVRGYRTDEAVQAYRRAVEARKNVKSTKTKESVVPDETKETAVTQAAPAGLSEADLTKLGTIVGTAVKEAMDAAANSYNAAAKGKAKNKKNKSADTSDDGPAESDTKAAQKVVGESISKADLEKVLTEEREKIKAELRESILKEQGVPQRQGFRTSGGVGESTEKEPTGEELWDKRGDIWAQFFPWGQNQAADTTNAAA